MSRVKDLIIDCDPGHDDAIAIMMALAVKDQYKLRVVTTVCGNSTVDKVTANAHYILSAAKEKIEVASGCQKPLINEPMISPKFHGESGMEGPTQVFEQTSIQSNFSAVEQMAQILKNSKDKVTILALGPLTNIALLIKAYPHYLHKIEVISMMGGGIAHGNVTKYAEFNMYVDPEAAHIVLSSDIPIVMCGLDVTEQISIHKEHYEYLREKGDLGKVFAEIMDFCMKRSRGFGRESVMLHDPCAMAYLIAPELFEGEQQSMAINLEGEKRGQTIIDEACNQKNVKLITKVKKEAVIKLIMQSIECTVLNESK